MKNAKLTNESGARLSWDFICNRCSVVDVEDAIEDSRDGYELLNAINALDIYEKFSLDRETETMVRLKAKDCFGNMRYITATKEEPKEKQLATHITNEINCIFDYKKFVEQMSREHRSLQSDFTTLCIEWLLKCREMYEEDRYDGRNEHACRTGKVLMDYLDKGDFK